MEKTTIIHAGGEDPLHRAIEVLMAHGLVAFPTDTVYGLGAFPWDQRAVARLYEAKQRPADRAIPLLLADNSQLKEVARLPQESSTQLEQLIARFWPGGLTLVLPKTDKVIAAVSPGKTVAVRVPALPIARDLIQGVGGALAVTSANISGQPSPITAEEVEKQLGGRIDLILDGGPCRGGVPSTILDCTTSPPRLLRHGALTTEDLLTVLDCVVTPDSPSPNQDD